MAKEQTVGERLAKFLAEYRAAAGEPLPESLPVPGGEVIDLGRTAFKLGNQYFALSPVRRIPDYEVVTPGPPGEGGGRVRGAVSKVIVRALSEHACHLVHYDTFPGGEGVKERIVVVLACRFPEKAGWMMGQARQWLQGAKRTTFRHLPCVGEGGRLELEVEW